MKRTIVAARMVRVAVIAQTAMTNSKCKLIGSLGSTRIHSLRLTETWVGLRVLAREALMVDASIRFSVVIIGNPWCRAEIQYWRVGGIRAWRPWCLEYGGKCILGADMCAA